MEKLSNLIEQLYVYLAIRRSNLFDREYYLRNNLDVARACIDPVAHYIRHGWREGRNPSPSFNTKTYLRKYQDVKSRGINPFYHYIKFGRAENRSSELTISDAVIIKDTQVVPEKPAKVVDVNYGINSGLISVIIPVYNTGRYLKKLMESLLWQTYNNFEVIVVDDGSRDKTDVLAVTKEYGSKLNLHVHQLDKNYGACYARNFGFEKSQGDFLFFCDADVILADNIFERLLQKMHDAPQVAWVYCNYTLSGRELRFKPFNGAHFYRANNCSTMSLIRRTHFPGFDVEIKRYQDWDLFLTIYENGGTCEWIDEFLFYAEDRHDGITNSNIVKDSQARAILQKKHPKVALL